MHNRRMWDWSLLNRCAASVVVYMFSGIGVSDIVNLRWLTVNTLCVHNSIATLRVIDAPHPETADPESKATCLWLHRLPLLLATNRLPLPECGHWQNQTASGQNKLPPSPNRAQIRATTYPGIARAMAQQWGAEKLIVQESLFS